MFEILVNKKIPTKNLYIVSLQQCVATDLMQDAAGLIHKVKDLKCFTLVRIIEKDYRKYYQDIFTKTLYEYNPSYFKDGNIYIYDAIPVLLPKPYITYKEALKAYNELNNLSQESENSNKTLKKHKKN